MYMILKFGYGRQFVVPIEAGTEIMKQLATGYEMSSDGIVKDPAQQSGVEVRFCSQQTVDDMLAFQALEQT